MNHSLTSHALPASDPESGITCRSVSLAFRDRSTKPVLQELSLQVAPGEIVSLLGPSGCGKSTLLRVIAGLQSIDEGTVTLGGTCPEALRAKIGFVFQEPALLDWRNVWQNVRLPFEIRHRERDSQTIDDRLRKILDIVSLQASDFHKYPDQLSGGMKMRTAIARALVTDPIYLLLDEPFAALDDILRNQLNDLLLSIWAERRATMLFVTHNISEALYLSHRVAIMRSGRIAETIAVPFEYPRDHRIKGTSEFFRLYQEASDALQRTTTT